MISVNIGEAWFNLRTVAVCVHEDHVLAHKAETESFWVLPGGRVETMEDSITALEREMREELGLEVRVEHLLWVVENFLDFGGMWHEIAFYHQIRLPDGALRLRKNEAFEVIDSGVRLTYRWFRLAELESVELYPAFLRTALRDLPTKTQHIIRNEMMEVAP